MSANGSGGAGAGGKTILDCLMHKLPSSRKHYQVRLVVPDNGIPFIDYRQVGKFVGSRKTAKTIQFVDLLFADKKHEASEKFAFSIYSIDKTITFLPQDESVMNEWLTKIRELHANLYPEFKRYDSIFEARLLDKGLATTMHIQGHYRLAVCKESLDLIPVLTAQDQQQQQQQQNAANLKSANSSAASNSSSNSNAAATTTTTTTTTNPNCNSGLHHNLAHHHHETNLPNTNFSSSYLKNHHHQQVHQASHHSSKLNQSQSAHHHHHHLPRHQPSHQRFCKRHPQLASKTIELVLRSIRRCGHTQANFYIESGRHSQIGEGDLWMALDKKSTARQLHELLLATMKLASTTDDQFLFKAPRSRSGSSSDNAHRSQQSRSSSLVCLNADLPNTGGSTTVTPTSTTPTPTPAAATLGHGNQTPVNLSTSNVTGQPPASHGLTSMQGGNNGNSAINSGAASLGGNFISNLFGNPPHQHLSPAGGTVASEKSLAAEISQATAINSISTRPMFPNHDNNTIEEDSGYLPMA